MGVAPRAGGPAEYELRGAAAPQRRCAALIPPGTASLETGASDGSEWKGAHLGREIERKFRVRNDAWRAGQPPGQRLRQGYLVAERDRSVRVRLRDDGAALTLKGASRGARRAEFEYPIPAADAEQILALCLEPILEKTRYRVQHAGHTWEIDCFHGANEGLVVAEIELDSEDEAFERPDWLGEEVTDDPRYLNANLFRHPLPGAERSANGGS